MNSWFLFAGCSQPQPITTTDADTDTSASDSTAPDTTGTTADTAAGTVTLLHWTWHEDLACWFVRETERPAEIWGPYVDLWCAGREYGGEHFRATGDGECSRFSGRFEGQCAVDDPEWLLPCSEIPGCCDHDWRTEPGCQFDPGYQP